MKNKTFENFEIILLVLCPLMILAGGVQKGDNPWAIACSVLTITYTLLAGKGLIYCYPFGILGTLICGIVSFNIGLIGNALLHILYYFPIEIYGFFNWKKNLKKNSNEIIKEKMENKKRLILGILTCILILILSLLFKILKNPCPILDSTLTSLSIIGMFLCVKRYMEQWAIWTIVNIISIFMWFEVFTKGEGVFSIFIVRVIYLFLGIYFYIRWRKELKND